MRQSRVRKRDNGRSLIEQSAVMVAKAANQHANSVRAQFASHSHSDEIILRNLCIDPDKVKNLRPSFGR